MNRDTALHLLARAMNWSSDEQAQEEFAWFALMSRLKYDDYRDFLAGVRFLESFVAWLDQFAPEDRPAAYSFVRNKLIYISAAERERLVSLLYPREIWPRLATAAADATGVPKWKVLADPSAIKFLKREQRSTLFLGLSDGAGLDTFRHMNEGTIVNAQVVMGVQLDASKWKDLLSDLRDDVQDEKARFTRVVLVDDFTASGTTFMRYEDEEWKGKLSRFLDSVGPSDVVHERTQVLVHHLLGTSQAQSHLNKQWAEFHKSQEKQCSWIGSLEFTFGYLLPESVVLRLDSDDPFVTLTQRYYNPKIETKSTRKGGVDHLGLGYAGCGLPLVLDHNTPNNSVALLWAKCDAQGSDLAMRPLFRRRQRHIT